MSTVSQNPKISTVKLAQDVYESMNKLVNSQTVRNILHWLPRSKNLETFGSDGSNKVLMSHYKRKIEFQQLNMPEEMLWFGGV